MERACLLSSVKLVVLLSLLLVVTPFTCTGTTGMSINSGKFMEETSHLVLMMASTPSSPKQPSDVVRDKLLSKAASAAAVTATAMTQNSLISYASETDTEKKKKDREKELLTGKQELDDYLASLPLGRDAYTTLGVGRDGKTRKEGGVGLPMCRILNGMWQLSGAHGFTPQVDSAIAKMTYCADEGFTTFDLADHYGPAEEYVGRFSSRSSPQSSPQLADNCQFFTKWVPRPSAAAVSSRSTAEAVARSLRYMQTDRLDLLQFHWWEYDDKHYFDAMDNLMKLQQGNQILNIGLTNFDTAHMVDLIEEGAPIVSNQVSFSVLDTRPLQQMAPACTEKGVKLLCYGTLLGGFLSNYWLGKPEPTGEDAESAKMLSNVSLRKYLRWIQVWGGWPLFQELLATLDRVAAKHHVSISNVAQRWVLDQPAVGGVIVGVRFGYSEHVKDNRNVFSFQLDEEDRAAIAAVQKKKRNDLMRVYGDCGGEYRARRV
mmetsp:Transcript_10617/g.17868  ORF Transcript_10617/g.17868 Transcript_10617/m.17868 type:complete len:487 (-) Transcript_10617:129-1589(-)|eukprot:CAMPEP_0174983402 /NCGR_PEP_ID=MMETSP0004_2-20121128/17109_1 /TAXON_ID=420556 /ORGANISM="Ochromonas sp., Strain CCMP1393" /LENGTH=486 /DNA_ID=CAMNT_0016235621 /DNA_START=58 /DNA_END=1521 /DNA_ORIENTATION=-